MTDKPTNDRAAWLIENARRLERAASRPSGGGDDEGGEPPMGSDHKHPTDRPTVERMYSALMEARTAIGHWLQLARRQREETSNADCCPCAPTTHGIAWSEFVIAAIDGAITAYVKDRDGAKETTEAKP